MYRQSRRGFRGYPFIEPHPTHHKKNNNKNKQTKTIKQTSKKNKEFNVKYFCFARVHIFVYKTCVSTPLPRPPFQNHLTPYLVWLKFLSSLTFICQIEIFCKIGVSIFHRRLHMNGCRDRPVSFVHFNKMKCFTLSLSLSLSLSYDYKCLHMSTVSLSRT